MQFLNALLPILSLLVFAHAKVSKQFVLKTQLLPGHTKAAVSLGDLYLTGFHNGAGSNDAVLLKGKKNAAPAFFNSTNQKNSRGDPVYRLGFYVNGAEVPYSLITHGDYSSYAEWNPTAINVGLTTANEGNGYFFNSTGLQGRNKDGFGGWLACEWSRGVPGLFIINPFSTPKLPSSCARVRLIKEAL